MKHEQPDGFSTLIQSTFDVLVDHIAVVDSSGTIVTVNAAWREFARLNGADPAEVCETPNIPPCATAPQSQETGTRPRRPR
jgi:hypothetical protein